jgi:HK97 family phage portal protein
LHFVVVSPGFINIYCTGYKIKVFPCQSSDLKQSDSWLSQMLGGQIKTKTGVRVSEESALKLTAVFACVRVISEGVATLPFPVYKRLEKGKEKARDHHLYNMLQYEPNGEMTAFSFRETMQAHLLLWGNAYAEIEYDGGGKAKYLWPIPPNRIKRVKDNQGRRRYRVTLTNGKTKLLYKEQVLHIPGLSLNGIDGLSPIGYAREAVGLGLATEEFGSTFFQNGANIGGVAEHPGTLSETGAKNLRNSLNETYAGLGKSHRLMLLEEGMKYHKVGIPPNESNSMDFVLHPGENDLIINGNGSISFEFYKELI